MTAESYGSTQFSTVTRVTGDSRSLFPAMNPCHYPNLSSCGSFSAEGAKEPYLFITTNELTERVYVGILAALLSVAVVVVHENLRT
ncbi:MAG: hypothetical protein M3X11_20780 [Acidobacteriota bacterium]|nr:hypothetical protein [Acidobacteriota bacterium]